MTIHNQTPAKQGVRARERNAFEKLDQIEKDLVSIVGSIQKAFEETQQRISALAEVLDATVAALGADTINQKIVDARKERGIKQVADAKVALTKALAEGQLEVVEEIGENTFVTGVEYNKEGVAMDPGYTQLSFAAVKPEYQEKMKGQKVGAKVETESGSFEITGVYLVKPKASPAPTGAEGSTNAAPEVELVDAKE